jgi:hypothetical protein
LVGAATGRALAALLAALLLPILVGATSSGRSPRRSVAVDFPLGRDRNSGRAARESQDSLRCQVLYFSCLTLIFVAILFVIFNFGSHMFEKNAKYVAKYV